METNNKQLVPLQKKINTLAEQAKNLTITSKEDMVKATTVLSNINKYVDSVKEQKETLTKPINVALKNIRSIFKPLEESYEEAIASIRLKMTSYQTKAIEDARAQENAITARVAPGKGNLSIDTAVKKISSIERPDKETSTDAGLVQFVETKRFEVIDLSSLPLQYHLPNEVEIRKAMKEGKELPGVRYWTEQVPRNFR